MRSRRNLLDIRSKNTGILRCRIPISQLISLLLIAIMKSSATTITKVGWVGGSATQHQDCSNIFHNCYYRGLNKFQVHTKPKPARCQANTSPLCCSQSKKRSYFSSCDRVASDFNRPLYGRYPSMLPLHRIVFPLPNTARNQIRTDMSGNWH